MSTWQTCPICKGTGLTRIDPVNAISQCTVCLGEKIISSANGLPPSMNKVSPPAEPEISGEQAGKSFLEGFLEAVNSVAEGLKKK